MHENSESESTSKLNQTEIKEHQKLQLLPSQSHVWHSQDPRYRSFMLRKGTKREGHCQIRHHPETAHRLNLFSNRPHLLLWRRVQMYLSFHAMESYLPKRTRKKYTARYNYIRSALSTSSCSCCRQPHPGYCFQYTFEILIIVILFVCNSADWNKFGMHRFLYVSREECCFCCIWAKRNRQIVHHVWRFGEFSSLY